MWYAFHPLFLSLGEKAVLNLVRCIFLTLVTLLGSELSAPAQAKQSINLEKLVKDLGDKDFRVRDNAIKILKSAPGALAVLRLHSEDKDLERRKRVRLLMDELSDLNCRRLLNHIATRKEKAPLDLLTGMVVQHSERLTDDDWRMVFAIIGFTRAHFLKDSRVKTSVPDPNEKFAKYILVRDEQLKFYDSLGARRVVTRGFKRDCADSAVFASGPISGNTFISSILLVNDGIKMADGAALLSDFVFSDGDVTCRTILGSLVIARGEVRATKTENAVIFDGFNEKSKTAFFSMESLGLSLLHKNDTLSVLAVEGDSVAEKGGFCVGDVLLLDAKGKTAETIERTLGKSLAKELELSVRVRRGGHEQTLFLSSLHK